MHSCVFVTFNCLLTIHRQQLARLLDRPLFPWKTVLAGFSLGQFILEGFLSLRQYKVLQQKKPPKVLEAEVSQKVFDESQVGGSEPKSAAGPLGLTIWQRRTVARRPSSGLSPGCTGRCRILRSSTAMCCPSSGD